jgi:hypothetical protein
MREAVDDSKFCAKHFDNQPLDDFQDIEAVKRKYYHVLHDRLRVMITLAEVEVDLNHTREGGMHLVSAQGILDQLEQYIKVNGLERKVPKTVDMVKRIKNGLSRVQIMGIAGSPSRIMAEARIDSAKRRGPTDIEGPHSGLR